MGEQSTRWFTDADREAVADFFAIYEPHYAEIFGAMEGEAPRNSRPPSETQSNASFLASRARIRAAFAGGWDLYESQLRNNAVAWVRMGVAFEVWFRIFAAAKAVVAPLLIEAYAADPVRLRGASRVMWGFFDSAAEVLAAEYIAETKRQLERTQAKRHSLLETSLDAMAIINEEGMVAEYNHAAHALFADALEPLNGVPFASLFVAGANGGARVEELLRRVRTGGRGDRIEVVALRAHGLGLFPAEVGLSFVHADSERFFTAVIRDVTERQLAFRALEASREEIRALARRQDEIREAEGQRIAREVHDVVGQALTCLKLDLSWLSPKLDDPTIDRAPVYERVRSMQTVLDATLQSVRRIATELRPAVLDDLGLVAAIEWQAQEAERRMGLAVKVVVDANDVAIPVPVATAVFRVFQEALVNVSRHAEAKHVVVTLTHDPEALTLTVQDDGRGVRPEQVESHRSLGVIGMRERATSLGGRLELRAAEDRGTLLTLRIPQDHAPP